MQETSQRWRLSKGCWECLQSLQQVGYVVCFVYFWTHNLKHLQGKLRELAPNIKDDTLKLCNPDGDELTFSMSSEALNHYRPVIQELVYFASAVRMICVYEGYIRQMVLTSYKHMPDVMASFEAKHRLGDRRGRLDTNIFWGKKLGRGIDFLSEIFSWQPNPMYRPALCFLFELRNNTVHKRGIVDDKLRQLASDDNIELVGELKVGERFQWNSQTTFQLEKLLIRVLTEADRHVASRLPLEIIEDRAFWSSHTL